MFQRLSARSSGLIWWMTRLQILSEAMVGCRTRTRGSKSQSCIQVQRTVMSLITPTLMTESRKILKCWTLITFLHGWLHKKTWLHLHIVFCFITNTASVKAPYFSEGKVRRVIWHYQKYNFKNIFLWFNNMNTAQLSKIFIIKPIKIIQEFIAFSVTVNNCNTVSYVCLSMDEDKMFRL